MFYCPYCQTKITTKDMDTSTRLDHCPHCHYSWSDNILDMIPDLYKDRLWSEPPIVPLYHDCPYQTDFKEVTTVVELNEDDPKEWMNLLYQLVQLTDEVLLTQTKLTHKIRLEESRNSKDRYETQRRVERAEAERDGIMYYQIQAQHILYLGTQRRLTHIQVRDKLMEEKKRVREWFKRMKEHYQVPPLVLFPHF